MRKIFIKTIAISVILILLASNSYVSATNCVFKCSSNKYNKIALTFDDGPHPKQTKRILNMLDKYNVKATFFVVGVNIELYGDALVDVTNRGHEIGNHTNSHIVLKSLDKAKIQEELDGCSKKLFEKFGCTTNLIRPPCGLFDENLIEIAEEEEMKIILWNIDTCDWNHESPCKMVKNIVKNVKGGDIILFHDYISGKNGTVEVLDTIIPVLKSKGFEFVTVSELLN